jgi:hypothetical protein
MKLFLLAANLIAAAASFPLIRRDLTIECAVLDATLCNEHTNSVTVDSSPHTDTPGWPWRKRNPTDDKRTSGIITPDTINSPPHTDTPGWPWR